MRMPKPRLYERTIPHLKEHAGAGLQERVLEGHDNHAIEGVGAIKGGVGPYYQLYALNIGFRGADEVPQGEVEPGGLIIHPIHDLEGSHGPGGVEAAGIDDLEA
jgi:hypothetical protein